MTSNDRKSVWGAGASSGLRGSSEAGKQTDGFNVVKHVGSNRTIVNGSTYYGASDARNAIKKLR